MTNFWNGSSWGCKGVSAATLTENRPVPHNRLNSIRQQKNPLVIPQLQGIARANDLSNQNLSEQKNTFSKNRKSIFCHWERSRYKKPACTRSFWCTNGIWLIDHYPTNCINTGSIHKDSCCCMYNNTWAQSSALLLKDAYCGSVFITTQHLYQLQPMILKMPCSLQLGSVAHEVVCGYMQSVNKTGPDDVSQKVLSA